MRGSHSLSPAPSGAALSLSETCSPFACALLQGLKSAYAELDAIVVGCSGQSTSAQRALVSGERLTMPLLSDPAFKLISPYGAYRSTFILDPSGTVRWAERNIDFGVGNVRVVPLTMPSQHRERCAAHAMHRAQSAALLPPLLPRLCCRSRDAITAPRARGS